MRHGRQRYRLGLPVSDASRVSKLVLVAVLAVLASGCAGGEPARVAATIATTGGPVVLRLEIADTTEERGQGLMGRTSLPERTGMLFVYPSPARGGFWMKDTLIPLSIAFLDGSGRILRILDMAPCRSDPCPVYDPGIAYRSALELKQGSFARLGVAVGDVLTVER